MYIVHGVPRHTSGGVFKISSATKNPVSTRLKSDITHSFRCGTYWLDILSMNVRTYDSNRSLQHVFSFRGWKLWSNIQFRRSARGLFFRTWAPEQATPILWWSCGTLGICGIKCSKLCYFGLFQWTKMHKVREINGKLEAVCENKIERERKREDESETTLHENWKCVACWLANVCIHSKK